MESRMAVLLLVISTTEFFQCGGLKFDVIRPPTPGVSNTCVKINCSTRAGTHDGPTVLHVISLTIYQGENKESEKFLATISSFDKEASTHEYSSVSKATGRLSSKGGNLNVEIMCENGNNCKCSREIYSCELRFINDEGILKITRAKKAPVVVNDVSDSGPGYFIKTDVLDDLKKFITGQISKGDLNTEKLMKYFNQVVENIDRRLSGLEDRLDKGIQGKLIAIEQRMTDVEESMMIISDKYLKNLMEIMNYTAITLENLQLSTNQILAINTALENQSSLIERKPSIPTFSETVCTELNNSISVEHGYLLDNLSNLGKQIVEKITSIENSSHIHGESEKRLIIGAIVKLSKSIDDLQSGLKNLNTQIGSNPGSIKDNLSQRIEHLTTTINKRLDHFSQQLGAKLDKSQMDRESNGMVKNTDAELDGRLVNLEINLQDIKIIMRDFQSLFGKSADD